MSDANLIYGINETDILFNEVYGKRLSDLLTGTVRVAVEKYGPSVLLTYVEGDTGRYIGAILSEQKFGEIQAAYQFLVKKAILKFLKPFVLNKAELESHIGMHAINYTMYLR